MRDQRSASQIQFGYLPEQTVDVQNGIWKVAYWNDPVREHTVDTDSLRRELLRAATPWRSQGNDGGFCDTLASGCGLELRKLNRDRGVSLRAFPQIWMCKRCNSLYNQKDARCPCGHQGRAQLPFVAYHECGRIREPSIPRCPAHRRAAVRFPGTASAREIVFYCPQCERVLRSGLGYMACECGAGEYHYSVHRAASVYTPRNIVMVNPPSTHRIRELTAAGGAARAMEWVLGGMQSQSATEVGATADSLRQQLGQAGLSPQLIEQMVRQAIESGQLQGSPASIDLPAQQLEYAERDAVTMALAAADSWITLQTLRSATEPTSSAGIRYREVYDTALDGAGLDAVELYDRFPVMVGQYAYTRGNPAPGTTTLKPFRDRNGNYTVYGEVGETEALLFMLDPARVCEWMRRVGHSIPATPDARAQRMTLLAACEFPGYQSSGNAAGLDLVKLIHSLSHRIIRLLAVHAGIERNGLSELLVPAHLGFYIYAAARDFVLGGLQAVFETDLHVLLRAVVYDEHRCALDPGCQRNGAACAACLHIGEPSCRLFNSHLSRETLFGPSGYYI